MRQLHGDADLPDFAAAWAAASLPAPPKVAGCDAPANLRLEGGAPSWRALLELVKRNVRNYKRNRLGMRARFGQTLFFALLIGIIFFGLGDDYAGIQDRQGLLFMAILNQARVASSPRTPTHRPPPHTAHASSASPASIRCSAG